MASTTGGMATGLIAHPGVELFAIFSPDKKWIAFTGQYDGDRQVLSPRHWRRPHGWTPDGKSVVFGSLREYFDLGDGRLYVLSVYGGLPQALPMPKAEGDYLLAIDGQELTAKQNPRQLLRNRVNRPVQLAPTPTTEGSHNISFRFIASETNLICLDWVTHNREAVSKTSNGKYSYSGGVDGICVWIRG